MNYPNHPVYPFPYPAEEQKRLLRAAAIVEWVQHAHGLGMRKYDGEKLKAALLELDHAAHAFCIAVDSAWAEHIEKTAQ